MTATDSIDNYEGLDNLETWAIWLSIAENQANDTYWRQRAMRIQSRAALNDGVVLTRQLAFQLAEEVGDDLPVVPAPFSKLLGSAMNRVNWDAVAARLLEGWANDPEGF